ncbi:MAG TPA: hypothetical protein VKA95_00190 [Nitrososphaeraceae archaeon]|nr:hypothetical protein [Nitrososphaeraceae archaeon]
MNNNTILRISMFLIAAALLVTVTTVLTMVPAAYAGGDNDDDDDDHNGDENNQKAEEDSAGVLADCDDNDVKHFECDASSIGVRFTGQDIMINGISATLLSDDVDPSAQ